MVGEAAVQGLKMQLRGELLRPGDAGYDVARKVWNGMIDKRPALIVRCAGAGDVVNSVKFAREHNLLVSVRGGGHNIAGNCVCDGGLMIDLAPMKGMRVDPVQRTAQAQPGLKLGEFDRETQAFGLATTLGIASDTGIAGITTGGGYGWLGGKYGLACDNLLSVDVVTAEGELVRASAEENPDLFWGVRGGSGNFGIVTLFEYQLHPVGPVLGGAVLYPLSQGPETLQFLHEFSSTCPDEVTTVPLLISSGTVGFVLGTPSDHPAVAIAACYCGPLNVGEKVLKPLRTFGSPLGALLQPLTYVQMQSMFDGAWEPKRQYYWKSSLIREVSRDAIEILVEMAQATPAGMGSVIFLQQLHGAASRIRATETAFPHRYDHYNCGAVAAWDDPAETEKCIRWARQCWEAMQPFYEHSVYVNDLGEEGEQRVREAYAPNYERLVALKNKYDPTNFFRLNQNIKPTA